MTYEEAKALRDTIYAELDKYGKILDSLREGVECPMGLTPDHIKFSPEYKEAKSKHDNVFQRLRNFNSIFVKMYKKEIQSERKAKYFNEAAK